MLVKIDRLADGLALPHSSVPSLAGEGCWCSLGWILGNGGLQEGGMNTVVVCAKGKMPMTLGSGQFVPQSGKKSSNKQGQTKAIKLTLRSVH